MPFVITYIWLPMKKCTTLFLLLALIISGCKKETVVKDTVVKGANYGLDGLYIVTTHRYSSGPPPGGGGSSIYTYNDTLKVAIVGADSIYTNLVNNGNSYAVFDTTSTGSIKHFSDNWWAGGSITYHVTFFQSTPDSIHGKLNSQFLSSSGYVEYWGHKIQ